MHFTSTTYTGLQPGPRIIIIGAVHGNETCGTRAIDRVMQEIDTQRADIVAGAVTFVAVANPLAFARGQRSGDRNLNRCLYPNAQPLDFEDRVANWLCPLLAAHDVLLDLHSFQAQGEPFVMMGPQNNADPLQAFAHATQERALALRLGVRRFVDGWLDTYAKGVERRIRESGGIDSLQVNVRYGVGTTEYMRSVGGYALTLECGQHDDAAAPEVAYRAIRNTLSFLGITNAPKPAPPAATEMQVLSLYEVIDKRHDDDAFSRNWASFDRVAKGDVIGVRQDGTLVAADCDGFIVFPDAKGRGGEEWFYLARPGSGLFA
jgi:predicted deacylase